MQSFIVHIMDKTGSKIGVTTAEPRITNGKYYLKLMQATIVPIEALKQAGDIKYIEVSTGFDEHPKL